MPMQQYDDESQHDEADDDDDETEDCFLGATKHLQLIAPKH